MDVFIFNAAPYKKRLWPAFIICLLLMAIAFTLHLNGFRMIKKDTTAKTAGDILFYASIAAAFWGVWRHLQRQRQIYQTPYFENRLLLHETGFRIRLLQAVLGCALTCFLLLLTGKRAFLWYSFFDLLSLFMLYPIPKMIRRELGVPGLVVRD